MHRINKIALIAVGDSTWQGGIQYITNIINALNSLGEAETLEVHLFKQESQLFSDLESFKRVKVITQDIKETFPPFSLGNRVWWFLQRKFAGRINPRFENYFLKERFDYVFPITLSDCHKKLNAGSWIADFQYHHYPDGHGKETSREAEKTISFIANRTKKIILSSEFCKKDSLQLFPVTREKIHVMPFSVYINKDHLQDNNLLHIKETYHLQEPYVMVSNLFAPTKNHKTLFHALGLLRKRGIRIACVCTGNFVNYARMEFTNDVLQMITENGIRDQLYILGLIPRAHQVALYRMATALVQPSVNEGWSTLVEEAKALGKKLLMSDIEVHQEQYPNNPYIFRSFDAVDLSDKLEKLWKECQHDRFPQLNEERKALADYQLEVEAFGKRFLEIAGKEW
jgi:glycosyltransferase involved in cell wall biosynthesis